MNLFLWNMKFHFAGCCSDVKLFGAGGQDFLDHRDSGLWFPLASKDPKSAILDKFQLPEKMC